jgi:hypothetical protein
MERNRNDYRLLDDEQIEAIVNQVTFDLHMYADETASTLVDHYLRGDAEELFKIVTEWVEGAEDKVIDSLNTELAEDAFRNGGFDGIH